MDVERLRDRAGLRWELKKGLIRLGKETGKGGSSGTGSDYRKKYKKSDSGTG